ncbi:MAG: hypothetical protein AAB019_10200, partial [Planctomycetota bacterium]
LLMLGYDQPDYHKETAFSPVGLDYKGLVVRVILSGSVIFLCHLCYGTGLYHYYHSFSFGFVFWRAWLIAFYTSLFGALIFVVLQLLENYITVKKIRLEKDELTRSRRPVLFDKPNQSYLGR